MRIHLKRIFMVLMLLALVPFLLHIMEALRFKPRKVVPEKPRQKLQLPELPNIGTCDNSRCNPTKEGMLNVHIVPHSHDDVGWKKTMQQYYLGTGGGNAESNYHGGECTRCVLNNAIRELLSEPSRRFIFVEMAFFSTWYNEITEEMRQDVKRLIKERRLELIIGGWCMSDSACTYYDDVIDQHTHGFQWIEKELGECAMPKSAWHVDQFGHSREHSSIFAQFGFDGLFLGRIDWQDQLRRRGTGNGETIWMTSPDNLGDKAGLFTSVMYDGYFSPERFRWEGWGPGMMSERNSEQYVQEFIRIAKQRATSYKTNHVLIPFGGDFAFNTAAGWFDGIDHLIKFVNAKQELGSNVNVLYSTPTCYVNSVNKDNNAGKKLEKMVTDFFPYGTVPGTYWTGFFTSRPGLKRHVKTASSLLQTCKAMAVVTDLQGVTDSVNRLKEAVAVLQHHDAITGTEMQHVTDDYNRMLSEGEVACRAVVDMAYRKLMNNPQLPRQIFCENVNISVCDVTENNNKFTVNVFNPHGVEITDFLRIPVLGGEYDVTGGGQDVIADVVPLTEETLRIPERGSSKARSELVFRVTIPPLGYASYSVEKKPGTNLTPALQDNSREDIVIANEIISLTLDASTGLTKTLRNVEFNKQIDFRQEYKYYLSSNGERRVPGDKSGPEGFLGSHKRPSGAYSFNPKANTSPLPVFTRQDGIKVKTFKGDNVLEVHQEFSPWATQVIRLYDGAPYLEFEWTIGPIPEGETKDVISHFQTNMHTHGVVYTDSNGREMIPRRLNKRETWNLTVAEPVAGNYYPVTARIALQDEAGDIQLTVLVDRSQGGASIEDGGMELMVHRRTFQDDDLGVGEPLNEKGIDRKGLIIRGKHYVFLSTLALAASDHRPMGLAIHRPPVVSFMTNVPASQPLQRTSFMSEALPYNIHLLTLDQVPGATDTILLRLENFYERNEVHGVEATAEVNLQGLFKNMNIIQVKEMSLGANHNITSVKRLRWITEDGRQTPSEIGSHESQFIHEPPYPISLDPMEIRTFHVKISKYYAGDPS